MKRFLRPFDSCYSPTMQALARDALRHHGRACAYLLFLLIGGGLTSLKFVLLKDLIHAGLEVQTDRMGYVLVATIACWVLGQLAVYAATLVGLQFERLVGVELVERTMLGLMQRSAASLRQLEVNHAVHFLRTGLSTVSKALRGMITALSQIVLVAFTIGTAFWLQPALATIGLIAGLAALLWTARHVTKQQQGQAEADAGERQVHTSLCRLFSALPQVKVYGTGDGQLEHLGTPITRQRRGERLALLGQRRISLDMKLVDSLAALAVVIVGSLILRDDTASLAKLTTMLALHQAIFQGLRTVLGQWASAVENSVFLTTMLTAQQAVPESVQSGARLTGPIEKLHCLDAEFAIGDTLLLTEVSCKLKRGRLYGVAGPAGSGKTMLLHLLSGHSRPHAGELLINDTDSHRLDGEDLRRRMALVTWPPLVLNDTLAENLRIARPQATDEELVAALRRVAFEQDLARLEPLGGLEARIGRKGVALSVGQLQRLALARTLLRAPEVLLLDDLLTGLDPVSAETVLQALRAFAQEHLVVMVAPNERAWRHCDELLITDGGRLVAQTTPDEAGRDPKLARLLFADASVAA